MATQKIKKTSWLRRRFIKGSALQNPDSWVDEAFGLRKKIRSDSTFQLVGDKAELQVSFTRDEIHVLIEVLGIPQMGLSIIDQEPSEVLIYEFSEKAFEVDFATLKERAHELKRKISYPLEDSFHIVSEAENLALHFFIQKDYILSTY